uniref:ECF transporter S component n=1 Tax=Candidatus Methanomethylicus mesodigestus TaxID=1867258 RepID=A0A7C3J4Z0_9CREN
MSRADSKAFKISLVASMIALTAIFELINRALPLRVPWGMSIDFVALPIIITFFLIGTRYSIIVALGMYGMLLVIGFAGFVGGTMKFVATVPMVLVFGGLALTPLKNKDDPSLTFKSIPKFLFASALAIIARCGAACVMNYYWAIPLFFSVPVEQLIDSMFFGSIWGFIAFISSMNLTQGIIDLGVAWAIVFGVGSIRRLVSSRL